MRNFITAILMIITSVANAHPGHGLPDGVGHQLWHVSLALIAGGCVYLVFSAINKRRINKTRKSSQNAD